MCQSDQDWLGIARDRRPPRGLAEWIAPDAGQRLPVQVPDLERGAGVQDDGHSARAKESVT
jgi:hypothetical protein